MYLRFQQINNYNYSVYSILDIPTVFAPKSLGKREHSNMAETTSNESHKVPLVIFKRFVPNRVPAAVKIWPLEILITDMSK